MKYYTFTVYLGGEGNTPEEAWREAVEGFALDPGWAEEWISEEMPEFEEVTA